MFKIIFFVLLIIGFIAYTGIDVTSEYDAISMIRDQALGNVFDPLAKKILKQASESNLDEIINNTFTKYGDKYLEM